jgi:hypothetical protein
MPYDPKNILQQAPGAPDQTGNYIYGYRSSGDCGLAGGDYYILGARLENTNDTDAKPAIISDSCSWPNAGVPVYAVTNP